MKFVLVPALLALLSVSSATVSASTIYTLDGGNSALTGYPAPYGTATVDLNTSTTATITFVAATTGGYEYLFGDGGSVAVNVNASTWTLGTISGTQLTASVRPLLPMADLATRMGLVASIKGSIALAATPTHPLRSSSS